MNPTQAGYEPEEDEQERSRQRRERDRERLREWHVTPAAVEEEALDARASAQYWAARHYLLRTHLAQAAAEGDATAAALLAADNAAGQRLAHPPAAVVALRGTHAEGVQIGRAVRLHRTDGSHVDGVVSAVTGRFRAAVLEVTDSAGAGHTVPVAQLDWYACI